MATGVRSNFGVPMFEPEIFRKQVLWIEESTCDTVGIFGAPIVIRRPDNCAPFPPSVRPCSAVRDSGVDLHDARGVMRLDGARSKAPPCLNLRSYGSKFTVLKEVFVTLLGNFHDPQSVGVPIMIRRPGNCLPLAPAGYAPECYSSICNIKVSG